MRDEQNTSFFQPSDTQFQQELNKLKDYLEKQSSPPNSLQELVKVLYDENFFNQNQEKDEDIINELRSQLYKNVMQQSDLNTLVYNVLIGLTKWKPRNTHQDMEWKDYLSLESIPATQYIALSNGYIYAILNFPHLPANQIEAADFQIAC